MEHPKLKSECYLSRCNCVSPETLSFRGLRNKYRVQSSMIIYHQVLEAEKRIRPYIHKTPTESGRNIAFEKFMDIMR